MKKTTKATIAAVAAGALLIGGAGTLALWQAEDNVDAGTVTTGHLELTTDGEGVWTDASPDAATTTFDPVTDSIVPGDTVEFNQTVTIDAEGKNIQGALTVGTVGAVPADLETYVTIALDVDASAEGITEAGGVLSFAAPGVYEVPVSITVTFDEGAVGTTPNTTMDEPIDLTQLTLTLDQIRS